MCHNAASPRRLVVRETIWLVIHYTGWAAAGTAALLTLVTVFFWLRYQLGGLLDDRRWRAIERQTDRIELTTSAASRVVVKPLYEWETTSGAFASDAGLSYLIEVDNQRILFDLGDRRRGANAVSLGSNLRALGYDPDTFKDSLAAVVISHGHREHVGGRLAAWFKRPRTDVDLSGVPLFTPWGRADGPLEVAPGVLLSVALPGRVFVAGRINEQMLIIRVAGRGLVCVLGDSHAEVAPMLSYAAHLTGERPFAVVGGVHALLDSEVLPRLRPFVARHQPWLPSCPEDIGLLAMNLHDAGVTDLYLSSHDSDSFSLGVLRSTYGERLRVLAVGETVEIF
jgi:7,8-dihydropterin-6-yl-methyl-4-(beta-D-ribofuranosyl)aminobenzene 5'-phosphate synthase